MDTQTDSASSFCCQYPLVSILRTKYILSEIRIPYTECKVKVQGHDVENVTKAVYLGVKFSEGVRVEESWREEMRLQ